jgi:DNA-binding SARP family transcriptional activator
MRGGRAIGTKTTVGVEGGSARATFNILGPLEIQGHTGAVTLRASRQRIVLTTLLLRANKVVSVDDIVGQLWPQHAPSTGREQVQIVISALRGLLRGAGVPGAAEILLTRRPGYLLQLAPAQLDAYRFEALLREADRESASGRYAETVSLLESALSLWRGHALTDVPSEQAVIEAQRLSELRLRATEKLIDAQLALGRHRQVVPQLTELVAAHPLRERLRGQLMIALNAMGRRAEALEAYRIGRRLMVAELGLEPGAELHRIERLLLAGAGVHPIAEVSTGLPEPTMGRPSVVGAVAWAAAPLGRPAQLPAGLRDFTGRRRELDDIRHVIADADTTVATVAITGPPGVGKTVLATHVGHQVHGHFPDGQLYVELNGSGERACDVPETLASMIAAFGVQPAAIPHDFADRVRMFGDITARRRVLVVLDDVLDAGQVWPLKPSGPGCAVLVTSRRRLPDLTGARQVSLEALPAPDALALLAHIVGPARVAAEPAAAERIVDHCGHLPLAVRIAGARLAVRPHWPLAKLAERLAAPERRLDELRVEDLDVRATLESALRRLPQVAQLAGRRLARLATHEFAARMVMAALGKVIKAAEDPLDKLVQHHVLVPAGPEAGPPRYRMPILTRLHLSESSNAEAVQTPVGYLPNAPAGTA